MNIEYEKRRFQEYPHLTEERINNQTPLIVFSGKNPFSKK